MLELLVEPKDLNWFGYDPTSASMYEDRPISTMCRHFHIHDRFLPVAHHAATWVLMSALRFKQTLSVKTAVAHTSSRLRLRLTSPLRDGKGGGVVCAGMRRCACSCSERVHYRQ